MTRFAALRAVRELWACSDAEISSLLRYTDEVDVLAGDVVAQAGRLCAAFVVVLQGTLQSGSCPLRPGDSFGWDAMWDRTANPTTVVAESNGRLLVMSHAQFRAVKGLAPTEVKRPGQRRVLAPA
jgi:CRP-like cAMP-binding protein